MKTLLQKWLGITDISIEIQRKDLIIHLVQQKMLSIEAQNKKLHTEISDVIKRLDKLSAEIDEITKRMQGE